MTTIVNIRNCAAWAASTTYVVGNRVSNDSSPVKAYQCTSAGTSAGSGGPTGTGASIPDGSVVWEYLSSVDYTSLAAANTGIGIISQPTSIEIWNDAEYSSSAAVVLSGHSTSSINTLIVTTAPGESFRDRPNNPLAYNQANGVGFANTVIGDIITVGEPYVTISNIQFKPASLTTSFTVGANSSATNCIIDSVICDAGQASNPSRLVNLSSPANSVQFRNSLFIVSTGTGSLTSSNAVNFYNCTVVRISATAPTGSVMVITGSGSVFENVGIFGFSGGFANVTAPFTSTTCATDITSPPTGWTGNLTYANQFQNTGSTPTARDFRLVSGSNLIDVGTTDTTDIPTSKDIVGTIRPQGSAWDIGAWEFTPPTPTNINPGAGSLMFAGLPPFTGIGNTIVAGLGNIQIAGYAGSMVFYSTVFVRLADVPVDLRVGIAL